MIDFLRDLKTQRWDDHRYYHHSRINQSLHLVSALSFLTAYILLFIDPIAAALVAWLIAMTTRQMGHFFFEPKGYDHVNQATHEHKEEIKVGYNLKRKVVLLSIWAAVPVVLWFDPTLLQGLRNRADTPNYIRQVGEVWLYLGLGGLAFRVIQLCVIRDVKTGVVWLTKIITDPFHDVLLYSSAPFHLLRGELIDPMHGSHR